MPLVVEKSTRLNRNIIQDPPRMNTLPLATPMARMDVIKINSASVFWEAFLNTESIKVLGDTYWDGFPVPVALPLEEPTNGLNPSSGIDMRLHGLDQRSKRSRRSIHQT